MKKAFVGTALLIVLAIPVVIVYAIIHPITTVQTIGAIFTFKDYP